jgi:Flp pilus assembly pilin Flp
MSKACKRLWHDRCGASLIEYTLLVSIVASTILGLMIAFTSWATFMWARFASALGP